MVNAGRTACLATPFLLTLGGLVCIIMVFLGGAIERNGTVGDLYFAKVSPAY